MGRHRRTRSLDDFTGFATIADGVDAYLNVIELDPWGGAAPMVLRTAAVSEKGPSWAGSD